MTTNSVIAESNNFIVLNHYKRAFVLGEEASGYQTERALERDLFKSAVFDKKRIHFSKKSAFVEKFKCFGGEI